MSTNSIKAQITDRKFQVKRGKKSKPKNSTDVTWGPVVAIVVVVALYLAVQIVSALAVSVYPWLKGWSNVRATNWLTNSPIGQFAFVVLDEGLTVAALLWFIRWRKSRLETIGLTKVKKIDPLYSLLGFGIYFVIYIVAVSLLSAAVHGFNVNQSQALGFSQSTTGWTLILVFLSLVLLPAIVEEILFRGFLFSGLKKALPLVWASIATSVIFAAPHLLESNGGGALWIAGVDTFILSLVLCWLREKTGRLYAGMGLHGIKNFIAFASLFLFHVH